MAEAARGAAVDVPMEDPFTDAPVGLPGDAYEGGSNEPLNSNATANDFAKIGELRRSAEEPPRSFFSV
ncbi:hypothetical protein F5Y16DRAFT_401311 [Xylariaceae sp. FL0255]|nr:hypothetical protein F5Y16DRAFT_401311 [Xylariaceae sp. FL0255]